MNIRFVSDNYFMCCGLSTSRIAASTIRTHADIDGYLRAHPPHLDLIIAVENLLLRDYFIAQARRLRIRFMILLPDIMQDRCFRMGEVVFSSLACTSRYLTTLPRYFGHKRQNVLTPRETDFMQVFHLQNINIARLMNISEKTASGHRINIQNKLGMRMRNSLAMLRIKAAISRSGACPSPR